jgi:hypothetical protein
MEANPSCLVWWLDAHCGYFVMCHERQLMFGHCILGDFRHLSWMPNLLLSLSRNLTKRWQKCDIRQSSIGQMLKSHFCHLFILVCSFRPALDCMICNVISTEAYWWTFHVRFKRFGLETFPMMIWSTSGKSLYFSQTANICCHKKFVCFTSFDEDMRFATFVMCNCEVRDKLMFSL